MSLRRLYMISEADEQVWPKHSSLCVCRGKGYIEQVVHGQLPALPGQNMGQPVQSLKKVECPYGDLKVNQPSQPQDPSDDEGWDI